MGYPDDELRAAFILGVADRDLGKSNLCGISGVNCYAYERGYYGLAGKPTADFNYLKEIAQAKPTKLKLPEPDVLRFQQIDFFKKNL